MDKNKVSRMRSTHLAGWKALLSHFQGMRDVQMRALFEEDPRRFDKFSLQFKDILIDFSKNRATDETMALLYQLANECHVPEWIARMFAGEKINHTEDRAVLHVALRNRSNTPVCVDGVDVMPDVNAVLAKMRDFSDTIRNKSWLGFSGKPITDVVNIGIGGSDLGPLMATEALRPYATESLRTHFVSNVDENHITDTLGQLHPETTLFIVASKTFTTQETLVNAQTARKWFLQTANDTQAISKHFIAVSNNVEAAREFGIDPDNIFKMWDWVGGRYSMWSAVGLIIAIAIGMEQFEEMLSGAYEMDEHFRTAPLQENIPVTLALLGVWYNNFFNAQTHAILPYDQHMRYFVPYLQQADMESNGKFVDREGLEVTWETGPIIFGRLGNQSQHAFYQLMHQGTKLISADIIAAISNRITLPEHHRVLMANVFAQAEAFMCGKTEDEARAELAAEGLPEKELEELLPYKLFPGNRPTNMILFRTLDPVTLGALIAMYEHKIYVQSIIWNINAFDQWGVELGKQLTKKIFAELEDDEPANSHDSSTNGLINYYKAMQPDDV